MWKLRDWIDINNIDFNSVILNKHPAISQFLRENINTIESNIDWCFLSCNPYAYDFLMEHLDEINWTHLSSNYEAIHLLEKNMNKIDLFNLCKNKNAMNLLIKYKNQQNIFSPYLLGLNDNAVKIINALELTKSEIPWRTLSSNKYAFDFLMKNKKYINYDSLSGNEHPHAIELLSKNYDKIDWIKLNKNPSAMNILLENPDKINWVHLSENSSAIDMLSEPENRNKISWWYLSMNNAIFVYDYEKMYKTMWRKDGIGQGLSEYFGNPYRVFF